MPASLLLVNPRASKGRDAGTLAALTERAGLVLAARDGTGPELVETAAPEDVAPAVREALARGAAAVVGVGGDGTLRQIAGVLAGSDVPLGIVPAGTGNQVAAVMGIPGSAAAAVDALERATARTVDVGEVTIERAHGPAETSIFLLGCGTGFDAELMASTSPALKRRIGTAAYFARGAVLALRLTARRCRITVDERVIEMDVTTALIGNMGQLVPGRLGLRLPLDPSDGLLDLIVVSGRNALQGVAGLVDQLRRTELGGDAGDTSLRLRGRAMRIEPLQPMSLQVDGDATGTGSLNTRIWPGALRVLVP